MERQSNPKIGWHGFLARRVVVAGMLMAMACVAATVLGAQSLPPKPKIEDSQTAQSVELDHVVAVVGDQAILQSDVEDEMRFTTLQSADIPMSKDAPQRALNRLIDRALIEKERALQPSFSAVSDAQVEQSIVELKKNILACAHAACSTDKGWTDFLQTQGFTEQDIYVRMQERLQVLKFIDWRFGSTVRISKKEVQAYYQQVLLPQFALAKTPAPAVTKIETRIRQILLEQHIAGLLDGWLKSLRSEGEVHIVDPAYASVGGAS